MMSETAIRKPTCPPMGNFSISALLVTKIIFRSPYALYFCLISQLVSYLAEEEVCYLEDSLTNCETKETTVNSEKEQIHWQIPQLRKIQITKTNVFILRKLDFILC